MMYDSQEKLARLRQHAAVVSSARIHIRVHSGNAVAKCGNRNARSGNPASPRGISRPTDNSAENSDGQENTSAAGSHEDEEYFEVPMDEDDSSSVHSKRVSTSCPIPSFRTRGVRARAA